MIALNYKLIYNFVFTKCGRQLRSISLWQIIKCSTKELQIAMYKHVYVSSIGQECSRETVCYQNKMVNKIEN